MTSFCVISIDSIVKLTCLNLQNFGLDFQLTIPKVLCNIVPLCSCINGAWILYLTRKSKIRSSRWFVGLGVCNLLEIYLPSTMYHCCYLVIAFIEKEKIPLELYEFLAQTFPAQKDKMSSQLNPQKQKQKRKNSLLSLLQKVQINH